jgi:hypothetical protein
MPGKIKKPNRTIQPNRRIRKLTIRPIRRPIQHQQQQPTRIGLTKDQLEKNRKIWNEFIESTRQFLEQIPFQCMPLGTSDKCAVIVEPRDHPHLEYVIRNVSHFLGNEWSILLVHAIPNENTAIRLKSILPNLGLHKLEVYDLNPSVKPGYNELLTSISFYNTIPAETILIFQTDSILLRKGIEEFVKYDYVGAAWYFGGFGNGGISLRKKSKMIEIIRKTPFSGSGFENEDVYFIECAKKHPYITLPTIEQANKFSVETVYYSKPLGIHNPMRYLSEFQLRSLLKNDLYQV